MGSFRNPLTTGSWHPQAVLLLLERILRTKVKSPQMAWRNEQVGEIKGTILEGACKMPFYTDLQHVLRAFGGRERDFDWLITDLDCTTYPTELQPMDADHFFRGDDFSDLVTRQASPVQYNWAVISSLAPGTQVDLNNLPVLPYADGNTALWEAAPSIQFPDSVVELVCWDSAATVLLTSDEDLTNRFRDYFPSARDLEEFNASRRS